MKMQEQRAFERFDLNVPATIEVMPQCREKILNLKTRDICAGGAFFHTAQPLAEGTDVRLDIVLDIDRIKRLTGGSSHIRVKGRVLRLEFEGMAVRFHKKYKITAL